MRVVDVSPVWLSAHRPSSWSAGRAPGSDRSRVACRAFSGGHRTSACQVRKSVTGSSDARIIGRWMPARSRLATRSPGPSRRRPSTRSSRSSTRSAWATRGRAATSSRTPACRAASWPSGSPSCSTGAWSSRATRARARAAARRASSRSAPTPGTSWWPTSARPASTSPSPRSTAACWATTTSRPASRPGRSVALGRVEELFGQLLSTTRGLPGRIWGIGIGVPGPVEYGTGRPISPPIMPGWDGYPVRERLVGPLRRPGLGRQRRQRPRAGRVAVGHRGGLRQRGRRQGRHGHRRRDHRRRAAAPRRAGIRGRRRAHPGLRGPRRRVPLRQHRLSRGPGGRRGDRARW